MSKVDYYDEMKIGHSGTGQFSTTFTHLRRKIVWVQVLAIIILYYSFSCFINSTILTGSSIPVVSDPCSSYFNSLYNQNKNWRIREPGAEPSFFSRKAVKQSIKHLRIYGKCILDNNKSLLDVNIIDLESRLFPYITRKLPISQDGMVIQ